MVVAFAVNGAYPYLMNMMTEHVKRYDDLFLITLPKKGALPQYTFPIAGQFVDLLQQYIDLRPKNVPTNRFFLNYHREKCTTKPIGKNNFNAMARRIAEYLKLTEVERYTRYSFRRSPNVPFDMGSLGQNGGADKQDTERIAIERTRPQKKSSFSYKRLPDMSRNTNINVNQTDAGTLRIPLDGDSFCLKSYKKLSD